MGGWDSCTIIIFGPAPVIRTLINWAAAASHVRMSRRRLFLKRVTQEEFRSWRWEVRAAGASSPPLCRLPAPLSIEDLALRKRLQLPECMLCSVRMFGLRSPQPAKSFLKNWNGGP